jgi:hypothetical protein
MVHCCNPSTQETEAGRSQVPEQPGLHSKVLCQKTKKQKIGPETFLQVWDTPWVPGVTLSWHGQGCPIELSAMKDILGLPSSMVDTGHIWLLNT